MRILIVDDNEMVRRGVTILLSSWPACEVCGEAKDGKEALLKAKELRPDLILLDVSMPGAKKNKKNLILKIYFNLINFKYIFYITFFLIYFTFL